MSPLAKPLVGLCRVASLVRLVGLALLALGLLSACGDDEPPQPQTAAVSRDEPAPEPGSLEADLDEEAALDEEVPAVRGDVFAVVGSDAPEEEEPGGTDSAALARPSKGRRARAKRAPPRSRFAAPAPAVAAAVVEPTPAATDSPAEPAEGAPAPSAAAAKRTRSAPPKQVAPEPKPDQPARTPAPLRAKTQVGALSVDGSLPTSQVARAITRVKNRYNDCYTRAARSAGQNAYGVLKVRFKVDERGRAADISVSGARLRGLSACVRDTTRAIITRRRPDVGGVRVTFKLGYRDPR